MQLSHIALIAVKGLMPGIIPKLQEALKVEQATIYRYIADNSDNLTKAACLKVIQEETGLSQEQLLTDDEPINTKSKPAKSIQ